MSKAKTFTEGEIVEIVPEPTSHPKWEIAAYVRPAWAGWHQVHYDRAMCWIPSRRIRKTSAAPRSEVGRGR